jgi:hypothetical protein
VGERLPYMQRVGGSKPSGCTKTNKMEWFYNENFVSMVKNSLPKLFKTAEIETTRGGKIGMEVGVLRERILVSMLIKSFGFENVDTDSSSNENSKDTKVFEDNLSIKTFTNSGYGGLKVFWASDNQSVSRALESYRPQHHLMISQICWGTNNGGLFLVPLSVQNEYFDKVSVNGYLKVNSGNNRGISIQTEVLKSMLSHKDTKKIKVQWTTPEIKLNIYERWIKMID